MSHHYYTNNTPHHLLFFILLFFLSLLHTPPASAVPAYPHPVEYTQPDGRVITIQLKGDERINWAETPDGYTILANRDGFYEYAGLDEAGDLVLSGRRVSPVTTRDQEERRFLEQLDRGLFFSDRQVDMMREVWKMREEAAARSFPSTGEQTLIAILMETADVPFQKTQEDFDALFNQIGYSFDGASGSVKEYYLENSYGLFDLSVDVAGPYTAEHDMAHYGATWSGARQLATEAVHLADPDVDYADYDNSGNGWVDGVYMIFAGYGEEAGGGLTPSGRMPGASTPCSSTVCGSAVTHARPSCVAIQARTSPALGSSDTSLAISLALPTIMTPTAASRVAALPAPAPGT